LRAHCSQPLRRLGLRGCPENVPKLQNPSNARRSWRHNWFARTPLLCA